MGRWPMKRYEPIREIKFATKSGFLTKNLWIEFFASGSASISWRNKQWVSFVTEKIFFPHYHNRAVDVLVPNPRHPLVKAVGGDAVASPPFVSQLDHDERLARMVLNLLKDGVAINYRLEAELKRLSSGSQRHYESQQKEKLPDALILLPDEKQTRVAIELELTKKDPKRYRKIMSTYASFARADKVVFVVRDERISQTIRQAMRDAYYPHWTKPVGFGRLEDWIQNPSTARISFTEDVTTLAEMAKAAAGKAA